MVLIQQPWHPPISSDCVNLQRLRIELVSVTTEVAFVQRWTESTTTEWSTLSRLSPIFAVLSPASLPLVGETLKVVLACMHCEHKRSQRAATHFLKPDIPMPRHAIHKIVRSTEALHFVRWAQPQPPLLKMPAQTAQSQKQPVTS